MSGRGPARLWRADIWRRLDTRAERREPDAESSLWFLTGGDKPQAAEILFPLAGSIALLHRGTAHRQLTSAHE